MSIKSRLKKLEQQRGGALPWLVLVQDLADDELFTDENGNRYRHGENWPDETEYQLLVVRYEHNWPPGQRNTAENTIQLEWPD